MRRGWVDGWMAVGNAAEEGGVGYGGLRHTRAGIKSGAPNIDQSDGSTWCASEWGINKRWERKVDIKGTAQGRLHTYTRWGWGWLSWRWGAGWNGGQKDSVPWCSAAHSALAARRQDCGALRQEGFGPPQTAKGRQRSPCGAMTSGAGRG